MAQEPGRGGGTEACVAAWGASCSGATCLRVLVQEARAAGSLGGCRVLSQEHSWSRCGSFHFMDEQLFSFPSSSFCPLLAWEALLPHPPRAFP